jgi:hypothetical protein
MNLIIYVVTLSIQWSWVCFGKTSFKLTKCNTDTIVRRSIKWYYTNSRYKLPSFSKHLMVVAASSERLVYCIRRPITDALHCVKC